MQPVGDFVLPCNTFRMLVLFQNVEGEHHEKAVELLKLAQGIVFLPLFTCYQVMKF